MIPSLEKQAKDCTNSELGMFATTIGGILTGMALVEGKRDQDLAIVMEIFTEIDKRLRDAPDPTASVKEEGASPA